MIYVVCDFKDAYLVRENNLRLEVEVKDEWTLR